MKKIKQFIQDNTNGYFYSIISNILRNTFLPYKSYKKKFFKIHSNFFHPEILIDTIGLCNAKCVFCSYRLNHRPHQMIDINKFKNWALASREIGFSRLNLTPLNGEFFMHKNHEEILEFSRKIGFKKIRTFSNCLNFNKLNFKKIFDPEKGLTSLSISTGGFKKKNYEDCYGVKKYEVFLTALIKLLEFFDREKPNVVLSIELRTNMTLKENLESEDFKKYIKKFYEKKLFSINTINKFDDWAGQINKEDLPKGMDMASNPIMQYRPCHRLYTLGILYDGIVRLCNCRYQYGDIKKDGLYLGNLNANRLEDILNNNLISNIRYNFRKKTPLVCKKCKFYIPSKLV